MSAATSPNFEKFRKKVSANYEDIIVISGRFSADTKMKEIIVYAKKIRENEKPSKRAVFVTLDNPIQSVLEGASIGTVIRKQIPNIIEFENVLDHGTRISVGNKEIGTAVNCNLTDSWFAVDTSDFFLHAIVNNFRQGKFKLPQMLEPLDFSTILLKDIAEKAPSDIEILGESFQHDKTSNSYNGPFKRIDYNPTSTYQTLWGNHNKEQQQMIVSPDYSLEPLYNYDQKKINKLMKTMSHIHINSTADTTSQSLMMAYTKNKVIGGSAYPSVKTKTKYEKGLAVWCNSTLGILCRWSMSNHQQVGRSRSSRKAIPNLVVPAPAALEKIGKIFDKFANQKLDRVLNLWKDPVRIRMDKEMLKCLGMDALNLDNIRRKLCAEPSIYGNKPPEYLALTANVNNKIHDKATLQNQTKIDIIDNYLKKVENFEERLPKLLHRNEDQELEYKETLLYDIETKQKNLDMEKDIISKISALMNQKEGGIMLIGVNDQGEPMGLERDYKFTGKKQWDSFDRHLTQAIKKYLGALAHEYITCKSVKSTNKEVCICMIKFANEPVFFQIKNGRQQFYKRTGTETKELTGNDMVRYIQRTWPNYKS